MALLEVDDLNIAFDTYEGTVAALNGVSLAVDQGEMLGLVGESGSGKSVLSHALLGQVRPPGRVLGGAVRFRGHDLLAMPEGTLQRIRGKEISLIVTNPRSQLNPMVSIGDQIANVYRSHIACSRAEARARAIEGLANVGIPDPVRRADAYPHQLSGGMAQRVLIAMALVCSPSLLVADDATNGLDVTVQRQVLNLMRDLIRRQNSAAVIVTHDLGIVARYCQKVAILYAGQVVEIAATETFFAAPTHPYSQSLLDALRGRSAAPDSVVLTGAGIDLRHLPTGCYLHPRCPIAIDRCRAETAALDPIAADHWVRCHVRGAERVFVERERANEALSH
jgi:oligopeptide/dipeptide ABC transporter ATP-binding protein